MVAWIASALPSTVMSSAVPAPVPLTLLMGKGYAEELRKLGCKQVEILFEDVEEKPAGEHGARAGAVQRLGDRHDALPGRVQLGRMAAQVGRGDVAGARHRRADFPAQRGELLG